MNKDVYNFAKFSGEIGVGIIGLGKFTKGVSAFKGGLQTVLAFKNSAYGYQGATSVVNTSTYIGYISSQVAKVTSSVSLSFSSFKEGKSSCGEVGNEYTFPESNSDIYEIYGVNHRKFHNEIKQNIIKDIRKDKVLKKSLKKLGSRNPDIGITRDGRIVLKNLLTGKTMETNLLIQWYLY